MQLATSHSSSDPSLASLLFPAAPTAKDALPSARPKAGFDDLFPDLAPARPPAVSTAALAAYRASGPAPDSRDVTEDTPSDPTVAEDGEPTGAADEAPATPAEPAKAEGTPGPRSLRSTPRAGRGSRGGAAKAAVALAEPLAAPGNAMPLGGEVSVVLPPNELPLGAGEPIVDEAGLFPGIDGMPASAPETRAPPPTLQTLPGLTQLMGRGDVALTGPGRGPAPRNAPADTPMIGEDAATPLPGFEQSPPVPDAVAAMPADNLPIRQLYTRSGGYFTSEPALPEPGSPNGTPGFPTGTPEPLVPVPDAARGPAVAPIDTTTFAEVAAAAAVPPQDRPAVPPSAKLAANLAVDSANSVAVATAPLNELKKSFVSADVEPVGPRRRTVGIDGAKSASTMFDRFSPTPFQHPASEYAAAAVASLESLDNRVAPSQTAVLPSETVNTAHVAVEAVLQAVEHVASREQKSVDLQFSVGGTALSVRVELHANEVRATFRTDSPELRKALSQEWQAAAATPANFEGGLRIGAPVFTKADDSAPNAFAGDAAFRQREEQAQRGADSRASASPVRPRASSAAAEPIPGGAAPAAPTSRHLYTLA